MTIDASVRIRVARPSHNPYWDAHGVTLTDPDGYRLVLSTRSWNPGTVAKQ
ncbi:hypothetical protein [Streptosporangium saharense]|uniref:hypothetical protein n=1 Tax=Streptosporangium saharense TaxID=1706840 RepID=UPI0034343A0A